MTIEEARKVAGILLNADGGCGPCIKDLCDITQRVFPEFVWTFSETGPPDYNHSITVEPKPTEA